MQPSDLMPSAAHYTFRDLPRDLAAGLALTAIAVPSQMATAHLAGFPPVQGFIAFAAGSLGFAFFGANRVLVICADSTIAPIFAGGLASLASAGSHAYVSLAASFALMVGGILFCAGMFRLGWLADLVSIPVTAGFLAGIAVHIIVSQLPFLLGIGSPQGSLLHNAFEILDHFGETKPLTLLLGLTVLGATICAHWVSPRIPGALIGIVAATAAVFWFRLEREGVAVLGPMSGELPQIHIPSTPFFELIDAIPLAFVVAAVIMVQTAATTRAFGDDRGAGPSINRDFTGAGAGNLMSGLLGSFAVDASPPLTETVAESGGRSKLAGLAAAALILSLASYGTSLLTHVPQAALAGTLMFVAMRLVRLREIFAIMRRASGEFLLTLVTFASIVILPVGTGVAIGIVLSLLHGMWSMTRPRLVAFERVPGTSIWWPPGRGHRGETIDGVAVIAFQAPLSFLNAYAFREGIQRFMEQGRSPPELIVLEASNIVEIDFTAAQILLAFVGDCAKRNITVAVARLESLRAQEGFDRFGIADAVQRTHMFHSVDEAIRALAKKSNEFGKKS
ncbi:MAG: SulP family inorganic anion transporter [Beijerinckiaceae bacterium]|nr:SulP family inorganic anion transporter [Beijerinckiaceae bacterium]